MTNKIDSVLLTSVRSKLQLACDKVGKELGINLKAGNSTYTDTNATMKIELSVKGYCQYEYDFNRIIQSNGWPMENFDRFECGELYYSPNHGQVKLLGAKFRAKKYPFVIEEVSTGNKYKITYSGLQALRGPNEC